MRNAFDDAIRRKFPHAFGDGLSFGDVPDGWLPIVGRLFERIEAVMRALPLEQRSRVRVTEITQKLGELRCYVSETTPEISAAIGAARAAASAACERCGRPGTRGRWDGPIAVRCESCCELERVGA